MKPAIPLNEAYWSGRYTANQTGWDVGAITPPLREYFDQLGSADNRRILVPGAGRAYEAEYLHAKGFTEVFVADIALDALAALQERVKDFPAAHLLHQDFFTLQPSPPFDLLVEQTFFCALDPTLRPAYAKQCAHLLRPGGTLAGLLFETDFGNSMEPPFGGTREEYRTYFELYFNFVHFETAYNSLRPRQGRELFICLKKR
ncbi:TPMT family class I SAM-dependent methyltransferase [Hymenobacter tibetensis]|uniref:TPMT family class I SAM-dependent methyltransferase n=1 Tax=Hymenobacter tibetensis TaxID=497967 RepID=A0ABY4CXN5_9BACT|nr:methyltransferase domain-containing protein [Hymenobacter tibetensis]UOG73796.1 TPMT family class I SAM-dependent methyltransferase [Hymenobacter tibetensis]